MDRSFVLGTLAALAFVSASTLNTISAALLQPPISLPEPSPPPLQPEPEPTLAFLERNLFGARARAPVEVEPCRAIALSRRLVATVIGESSVAWFGGEQLTPVRPGDRIDGAEVVEIDRGVVRLSRDGTCAEVSIAALDAPAPEATLVRRVSENEISVERSVLEAALTDPLQFGRDARIVPKVGKGFAVFAIRPGGIADQLGLAHGDVLERINGHRLDEPSSWFSREDFLRGPEITLDYTRNGERRTLTLTID